MGRFRIFAGINFYDSQNKQAESGPASLRKERKDGKNERKNERKNGRMKESMNERMIE